MPIILHPQLLDETLVRLVQAGKLFPGGGVSPSCIERWVRKGVNGVRLETCRSGTIRYTSHEAIRRFLEAQNRTPDAPVTGFRRMSESEIERKKEEFFGRKKPGPKPARDAGMDA